MVLQEEQFAQEFLNHNGLVELAAVIYTSSGNTLAVCCHSKLVPSDGVIVDEPSMH
jgi:hypothetical protein